jgi:hypothetical protein
VSPKIKAIFGGSCQVHEMENSKKTMKKRIFTLASGFPKDEKAV